jgi:hypothetical protein
MNHDTSNIHLHNDNLVGLANEKCLQIITSLCGVLPHVYHNNYLGRFIF